MSNLEIWSKVSRPPANVLKKITGGRLSGMTDVNPQWRIQVMTEVFGPVGIGWYYEIVKFWTEPGAQGEVMAFAQIALYTKAEKGWSAPIAGIGGSALVAKESGGLRANDEAFKMAVTDALSVAMKQLGVAADIYAGLWDGSKYKDAPPPKADQTPVDTKKAEKALSDAVKKGTAELRKVWEGLDDTVRMALKDKLAGWKITAKEYDEALATQP
jgi:hypothetical protein